MTTSLIVRSSVMPAKAGIQNYLKILNSRIRGNDAKGGLQIFYETIKLKKNNESMFRTTAKLIQSSDNLTFYMSIS